MDIGGMFANGRWELLAAGGGAMMFVLFVAAGLRATLARRHEVVDRIERTLPMNAAFTPAPTGSAYPRLVAKILRPLSFLARPTRSDELARLRSSLVQGGLRGDHAMEIFLGVKLGSTPLVTGAFLLLNSRLPNPIAFPTDAGIAFLLVAISFFLPNIWLRSRISGRQAAIERSLPDAMDLLVTCVEAGLGLDAAIARVSEEMVLAAPLLAGEMHHTFLEIHAGVQRADAFRRLADRTGVEDLRALSAMLIQTDMFGTSIGKSLRVHGDSMRIRRAQRAEEKAAMASVKMTIPLILCILPSLIAIVMGPAIVMIVRNFAGQ